MKVFWALMLVLALAAGGLLFARGQGEGGATEKVVASSLARGDTEPSRVAVQPSGGGTAGDADRAPEPARQSAAEAAPAVTPAESPAEPADAGASVSTQEPAGAERDADAGVEAAAPEGVAGPEAEAARRSEPEVGSPDAGAPGAIEVEAAVEPTEREQGVTESAVGEQAAPEAASPGAADVVPADATGTAPEAAPETAVSPDAPEEPAPNEPAAAPADVGAPVAIAAGADGVLLLDGQHRITGAGTAAEPYVVSWETLVALERDYEPKTEGKKQIPEWITALDGKHVSITGFIAFPFIAPTADECMLMLNQWDGCCIGVPPTPYDAVEVKLAETLDLQQGVINYGTITGVFRTDPYLVNGWLIGLYVMEDAVLTKAGGKNTGGF